MSFITVFFEANISALENKQSCIYAQKLLNKGLYLLYVSFMSLLYLIMSKKDGQYYGITFQMLLRFTKGDACSLFHGVALQLPGKVCKTGIYLE